MQTAKAPLIKHRIKGLIDLNKKTPGELLVHILELKDKVDEHTGSNQDLMDRIDEFLKMPEKIKPVKGKDYMTPEEVEEMKNGVLEKIQKPEEIDYEKINTDLAHEVMAQIPKPKEPKDPAVDYEKLAKKVSKHIELPEDGRDGKDGKDGSPDTGDQILDKIEELGDPERTEDPRRLHVKYIAGLETFPTRQDVDFQLSTARNQISYLINKVESLSNQTAPPSPGGGYAYCEIPSGTVDGINATFTLAHTPVAPGTMLVTLGGIVMSQLGGSPDYSVSGNTITFTSAPITGTFIQVYYS